MTFLYFFLLEFELLVESWYEVIVVVHTLIVEWITLCIFISSEVDFFVWLLLLLLILIAAEYLLYDTNWRVVWWMPCFKLGFEIFYYFLVVELLAFESVKLTEPCFADNLSTHCSLESIISKFEVLLFVLECTHCTLHSLTQFVGVMLFENKARSLFGVPVEFVDWVFETTCFESNNRCSADKEFMLDDTSWLESGWHESEISTSIN